jgi:unsaturated rhamnogalacturonyl hydrolase
MAAARDAVDTAAAAVDENGAVRRVVGPPGGPGVPFAVTSYGQGWYLLAARELASDSSVSVRP